MRHCPRAATLSAVKLETAAWEQRVDAPGQVALEQNENKKHNSYFFSSSLKINPSTVAATIPLTPSSTLRQN